MNIFNTLYLTAKFAKQFWKSLGVVKKKPYTCMNRNWSKQINDHSKNHNDTRVSWSMPNTSGSNNYQSIQVRTETFWEWVCISDLICLLLHIRYTVITVNTCVSLFSNIPATSVATMMGTSFLLKLVITLFLSFWSMSPCNNTTETYTYKVKY